MCRYRLDCRGQRGRRPGWCRRWCRGWSLKWAALLLCALLLMTAATAECDELQEWLLPITDELLPDDGGDESAAADWVIREAAAFRANPVDLNSCSLSDLLLVPFIDPASAVKLSLAISFILAAALAGPCITSTSIFTPP